MAAAFLGAIVCLCKDLPMWAWKATGMKVSHIPQASTSPVRHYGLASLESRTKSARIGRKGFSEPSSGILCIVCRN